MEEVKRWAVKKRLPHGLEIPNGISERLTALCKVKILNFKDFALAKSNPCGFFLCVLLNNAVLFTNHAVSVCVTKHAVREKRLPHGLEIPNGISERLTALCKY